MAVECMSGENKFYVKLTNSADNRETYLQIYTCFDCAENVYYTTDISNDTAKWVKLAIEEKSFILTPEDDWDTMIFKSGDNKVALEGQIVGSETVEDVLEKQVLLSKFLR